MEIYDSPLNLAHLYADKAETAYNKKDLDTAIKCHEGAAEHLVKARDLTNNRVALESIELQEKYHRKQVELLKDRKRKAEAAAIADKSSSESEQVEMDGMELTETCRNQLYDTLNKCDTLLQFLNNGKKVTDNLENNQEIMQATKKDKGVLTILEELMIHNNSLRRHILSFILKVEELENEKKEINEQLSQSQTEVEKLKEELKNYKKE